MNESGFDIEDSTSVEAEVGELFRHGAVRGLNARQMSFVCALALAHMARDCTEGYEDRRETCDAFASLIRRVAGIGH